METQENKFSWLKTSVSLKITVIGFIILIMLIPANLIKDLMRERQHRLNETLDEVTSKWGESQQIGGLIITVPCIETSIFNGKKHYETKYLNILPDKLDIEGEIIPVYRYRGIYKVLVYQSKIRLNGWFDSISLPNASFKDCEILWDKATIALEITDPHGINNRIDLEWNGKKVTTTPGTGDSPDLGKGIHISAPVNPNIKNSFSIDLDINGSGLLSFLPLGKETNLQLSSSWAHPHFDGNYLPDKREISDSGFVAHWKILEYNRDFPQHWFGSANLKTSGFGVELIESLDVYQKSMRAVKYAMLFVILTFLVFLFSELIYRKKAHPIQYIMVGAALCVFFSLLIALSEHLHFNLAYAISTVVIIAMITMFSKTVFKNRKVTTIVFMVLVALFAFVFIILQMADYSLIFGNIGLVIALAIVMYVSRKIDWYRESVTEEK